MRILRSLATAAAALALGAIPLAASPQSGLALENGRLRAEFEGRTLVRLTSVSDGRTVGFEGGRTGIVVDGVTIDDGALRDLEIGMEPHRLVFSGRAGAHDIDIIYELRPGWDFITRQIVLNLGPRVAIRVGRVTLLDARIDADPAGELPLAEGRFGACLRFGDGGEPDAGVFFALQNPFMEWRRSGRTVTAAYTADMDWSSEYGPFASDRLCIGLHALSGEIFPARAVPEWKRVPDYAALLASEPVIDRAEVDALTECVRAFLLYRPERGVRLHIPWCENDYQIDAASPDGIAEYKRIMDRAAELGCGHLLYTPANSALSSPAENADAWGWENLLFFALGQKIRKGEWDPRLDAVPPRLGDMLAYAAAKPLRLFAYAYPSLPFTQDPAWTAWAEGKTGGYAGADTGRRGFQDWWVETLLAFLRKTGASGFSFDHWWIAHDDPRATSRYAQWFGCRRILETLRRQSPGIVIDGRQQYQGFGPWTWLAGTYPHPSLTDEQPESFTAFPDLHTDRVSADRQRFAAWVYRVERFCPPEIMPGFITHQSERSDAEGVMRRDRFRPRDWDLLGWKYSLLSSIATAPFNHVINFIPARDPDEFAAFSAADAAWFRRWLDWTDANAAYLRNARPILGPPMLGRADGWAAVKGDSGYVFLFNPNPGRVKAAFRLDGSIGLDAGERFVLRELHPEEGRLAGAPGRGFWLRGDEVAIDLPGADARVLELFPAPEKVDGPVLFDAPGEAAWSAGRLALTGVAGEPGTERMIRVLVPKGDRVQSLRVNGRTVSFARDGETLTARLRFAGAPFGRLERVGEFDPEFAGGTYRASFRVPARVRAQLEARKKSWPVPYTADDLEAAWLGSWRLLLFAAIAEPDDAMAVSMTVDGRPVEVKKAYNSVYRRRPERTFLGHYADLSGLKPDVDHVIETTLPPLRAGNFLGLFFENVEPESTTQLAAPAPARKKR